ncbi:hypothetical protein EJ05DRAFT_204396 [Pseudovirgaria hyperparasitica]|uniref:Uncharacterized protein n=1 Tax=Pseudovirgaria hyperparasitica TaxID=470096 RepID=A0A6A6WJD6_9PEZI|nr:uncharacterized protein EJ05DRAFT_204396 [Pseudovirgaria hyperparasitica]KAF2762296.1 hypothetical protein EJ05DRAFT_204396 [Pseudovirgaria hyperparasitica]
MPTFLPSCPVYCPASLISNVVLYIPRSKIAQDKVPRRLSDCTISSAEVVPMEASYGTSASDRSPDTSQDNADIQSELHTNDTSRDTARSVGNQKNLDEAGRRHKFDRTKDRLWIFSFSAGYETDDRLDDESSDDEEPYPQRIKESSPPVVTRQNTSGQVAFHTAEYDSNKTLSLVGDENPLSPLMRTPGLQRVIVEVPCKFRLMDLPGELRNYIYAEVFAPVDCEARDLPIDVKRAAVKVASDKTGLIYLMNHELQDEIKPLIHSSFKKNIFHLRVPACSEYRLIGEYYSTPYGLDIVQRLHWLETVDKLVFHGLIFPDSIPVGETHKHMEMLASMIAFHMLTSPLCDYEMQDFGRERRNFMHGKTRPISTTQLTFRKDLSYYCRDGFLGKPGLTRLVQHWVKLTQPYLTEMLTVIASPMPQWPWLLGLAA